MAKLLGTAPSQVPTNADLGSMAFQDVVNYPTVAQAGQMVFRNRLINGDMQVNQYNSNTAVTAGFPLDRFRMDADFSGLTMTYQRLSDTPPVGFTHYLRCKPTAGAATPTAAQTVLFSQFIEGINVADLAWGTTSASPVTVSFWTRSSLTGQFSGAISNGTALGYPFSFTINTANTWEYKTVVIPGATTGTWNKDNTTGMILRFNLGSGSNWLLPAGSWGSATQGVVGSTGSVNLSATLNATLDFTGIQLEKGVVATPYETLPIQVELDLCRRYFERISTQTTYGALGAGYAETSLTYKSYIFYYQKRVVPTITFVGALGTFTPDVGHKGLTMQPNEPLLNGSELFATTSGLTPGYASRFEAISDASARILISAEL